MPKITFDSLDAIPEGLRAGAKTEGDKVVIDVVETAKLNEFRDNNVKLSTERDTLQSQVSVLSQIVGEDADAFTAELAELRSTAQQVKDGKLKGSDSVAKEVESRVSNLKTDYEKQLQNANKETNAWKEKATTLDTQLKRTYIDREVTAAVLNEESGADSRALGDILTRSYSVFQVEDGGKLTAKNGEATIYGADGATPMQPLEWLEKLKEEAPYFFKKSQGGAADGGNGKIPGNLSQEDFTKLSGAQQLALARQKRS